MKTKLLPLLALTVILSGCTKATLVLPTPSPSDSQPTPFPETSFETTTVDPTIKPTQDDEQLLKELESDADLNFDAALRSLESDLQ